MLICKLLLKILMDLLDLMWLLYVLNLLCNVFDKKWILSILKLRKLILKFCRLWQYHKIISNLLWEMLTQPLLDKPMFKFPMLNGRILVVWKKSKNNFKK